MKSAYRLSLLFLVFAAALRPVFGEIERTQDTLSIDIPNETRRSVMRQVADLFELNLVIGNDFPDDKFSIKLRDVSWRRVFEMCTIGTGYIYIARGNVIWIVPPDLKLGEFGQLRDRLDRESEETHDLRRLVAFLTREKAPKLTREQRAQIKDFLANPTSSAYDLMKKLEPESEKPAAPAAK
ncbi:MAG TPA: hypothetical protein VHD32_10740 [Candidatus Didemnitutus sp.]|nr:hypothetical protein [Candidatus Didemnitutus sp.]